MHRIASILEGGRTLSAKSIASSANMARGGLSLAKATELSKARRVVQETMAHEDAVALFNEPVDPVALELPDYHDIVKARPSSRVSNTCIASLLEL